MFKRLYYSYPCEVKCVRPSDCPFSNFSLMFGTCFKFGTHVTHYKKVCRLLSFSWDPQIWIFGKVFEYTTLTYSFVHVLGRLKLIPDPSVYYSHFNAVCLYLYVCLFIYVPRFTTIADFPFWQSFEISRGQDPVGIIVALAGLWHD